MDYVVEGAELSCPRGSQKQKLQVMKDHGFSVSGKKLANIADSQPMTNIMPFGTCKVPPPVNEIPCSCALSGSFISGKPDFILDGQPVLTKDSMVICSMGGVITFEDNGQ